MADTVPQFHWSQIDHSLVALKLTSIAEDMREFPAGTDPESIRRRTDEYAQRVYEAYCEVWVDRQRGQKSPAFILAVLQQGIIPLIAGAQAGRIGELSLQEVRTRQSGSTTALQSEISRTLKRLATKWRRKLETEAKECAYARRPGLALEASNTATEANQGVWAGDLIPPDDPRSGGERAPLAKAKHIRPPLQRYKSGLKRAIVNALVRNPKASDLQLCRLIDEDGTTELDGKDRTLEAAYRDPKRKPRLETTISKVRRDLRESGLL